MIQRCYGPRFALESLGEFLLRYFDRHRAIQPCVAGLIHLAHSSRADEDWSVIETVDLGRGMMRAKLTAAKLAFDCSVQNKLFRSE
jgi:hypothetical protein